MSEVLTVKELSEILKIHYNQALALLKAGSIPYIKIGKTYRVPAAQVKKLTQTETPIILTTERIEENGRDED